MEFQAGDIYLVDSDRVGARIVKFLMTAPTLWQYIWRALRHTQQKVRFYHAGMCVYDNKVIEQQGVVEYEDVYDAILKKKKAIVYRYKHLTEAQKEGLLFTAYQDLGEKYDWLLIIGRTLTWLTGIKWFTRKIQLRDHEFCVTRVAYWFYEVLGVTFGQRTWHEVTTDSIDDFCKTNTNDWEVVYES